LEKIKIAQCDIVFDQTEAMMVVDVNSGRSKEEEQEKER
ncbi:MAG: hypothetical protein HGA55_06490, partial [Methanoregulaceae archaeon]|nr:hypothetical protein [Methanoregulaceae archaeon]